MTPLAELATLLGKTIPEARIDFSEPQTPGGIGFLDLAYNGQTLDVQWQEKGHFGLTSPECHGYGEKPDEIYSTAEEVAARVRDLLQSGRKTEPPPEVTIRELRAERKLPQTVLATLLGVSQPAVSQLERRVSRMRVATLKAVIEALGGRLVIQAHFPQGLVRHLALEDDNPESPKPGRIAVKD